MTNQAIHRNIVNELFIVRASIKKKLIKDINLLFQIRIHILHSSPQFFFYDTFFFFSILYFVHVFACFVLNGNRSWYMV